MESWTILQKGAENHNWKQRKQGEISKNNTEAEEESINNVENYDNIYISEYSPSEDNWVATLT